MSTPWRFIGAAVQCVRRPEVVRQYRKMFLRQWWKKEDLQRFCDGQTRALAAHAGDHVDYYRAQFRALGIDSRRMLLPDDWVRLPVLQKEDLKRHSVALASDTRDAARAVRNASGGSTGTPVEFLSDRRLFTMMYSHFRLIFEWAGWRPGEVQMNLWGGRDSRTSRGAFGDIKAMLGGQVTFSVYSYDEASFAKWWSALRKYSPTILYVYPSVAAEFAAWLETKGYQPTGLKGVFCSAEVLLPKHREVMERVFGCKVFNQYGSREAPCIACECPAGNMHVFQDLNHVEFLENPADPGGMKRIVATPLNNYSQPLLRYELGDLGEPLDGSCPCGRAYPLMSMDVGRRNDHLRALDGRNIYPSFFVHLLDGKAWVGPFRFRQASQARLELEFESLDGAGEDRVRSLQAELLPRVCKEMGEGMLLEVRLVERIERTAAGKFRHVVNNMDTER
ncbi:MAG: Phenylacetate-coenzyme A ligase [Syntrophorhabdaceae bacterium PtaU1.Bin034]|nr:MAG: Phenylacetate-coenzyme A ligase [Syntrophorhabdaceae bacterium PtaU1.Bin034]